MNSTARLDDPATRTALLASIRKGATIQTACRAARIDRSTYFTTRNHAQDAAELAEEDRTPRQQASLELWADVEQAHAEALMTHEQLMFMHAQTDWRCAAHVLARLDRRQWNLEDTPTTAVQVNVNTAQVPDMTDERVVASYWQARASMGDTEARAALARADEVGVATAAAEIAAAV